MAKITTSKLCNPGCVTISQLLLIVIVVLAMRSATSSTEVYLRFGLVAIWFFFACAEDSKALFASIASKPFICAICFVVLRTLYSVANCDNPASVLGNGVSLLCNFSFIVMGFFYIKSEKGLQFVSLVCALAFFYFCAKGVYFYLLNPAAARSFAMFQDEVAVGGGYGLGFGAGVIAVLLAGFLLSRNRIIHGKVIAIAVVLGIAVCFFVQSTIILISVFAGIAAEIGLAILRIRNRSLRIIGLLVLVACLVFVVIGWPVLAQCMIDLNDIVKNDVTDRIRAIGALWLNDSESLAISGRQNVYFESIFAFYSNPLVGAIASVDYESLHFIGNHSTFLNEYGWYGIFVGTLNLLMFCFFLTGLSSVKHGKRYGTVIACVLMALFNPITQPSAYCMIFLFVAVFDRYLSINEVYCVE